MKNTIDIVVIPLMSNSANDVAPIQVRIPYVFSHIECIPKKVMIRLLQWYWWVLGRIMESVTFDIDLAYERIHIAWVRYKTNLVYFTAIWWIKCVTYLKTIFSIDMICSSGGCNEFSRCISSGTWKRTCWLLSANTNYLRRYLLYYMLIW